MYKIIHGHIEMNELFTFSTHGLTRGHNFKIEKPIVNNNARAFSFSCRRIDCWNSLPEHVINLQSIKAFRSGLQQVNLSKFLSIEM